MVSGASPDAMPTLQDAINWATSQLKQAGIESPVLDAELLLCTALNMTRSQLHLHRLEMLAADSRTVYMTMVQRRVAREPLAYITGQRAFYDLDLAVNQEVLIPRPETELLVEQALAWLSSRAGEPLWALDVGTGSGAIAVTLARKYQALRFVAVDISLRALAVARMNIRRYNLQERVHLVCTDLLKAVSGRFDLIVANLPYIPTTRLVNLQPEVSQYEPRQALDGGKDGLEVIMRLYNALPEHLNPGALVLLEIDEGQGTALSQLLRTSLPGSEIDILNDYAGLERIIKISVR